MKKYVILVLVIIGLMIINGCAHHQLVEADKQMVKSCKFIATISNSFHNPSDGREFLMDQAAERGATHVIFSPPVVQTAPVGKRPGKYLVKIKSYNCNVSD